MFNGKGNISIETVPESVIGRVWRVSNATDFF